MDQIVGEKPSLEGKALEEMIAQAYFCEGKLVEDANVIWIKQGEKWHHLCFDESTIFWRLVDSGPIYEKPEEDDIWDFPLKDLIEYHNLECVILESIEQVTKIGEAFVKFTFANGVSIKIECIRDVSSIKT